jgi:hypothetical protein
MFFNINTISASSPKTIKVNVYHDTIERQKTEIEIDLKATIETLKNQWAQKLKIDYEKNDIRMAHRPVHAILNDA